MSNQIKNPKVGDKLYYEFQLCTVKEVENGCITCLSDGYFQMNYRNFNDECRPVSKRTAALASMVSKDKEKLYNHECSPSNGPDFHRSMVEFWLRMVDGESPVKYKKFVRDLKKKMNEVARFKLNGFKPFIRR